MQLTIAAKQIARQYRSWEIYRFPVFAFNSPPTQLRDCFGSKAVENRLSRVVVTGDY
jgi:hypothetical protein